jgi:hypothetical protein
VAVYYNTTNWIVKSVVEIDWLDYIHKVEWVTFALVTN